MTRSSLLYLIWGILGAACAALGFIEEPSGSVQAVLTIFSLFFFLPPVLLLREGHHTAVLTLSCISLAATAIFLCINILTALGSTVLGNICHVILGIVSVPMFSSGFWVISLFLWACMLFAALGKRKGGR